MVTWWEVAEQASEDSAEVEERRDHGGSLFHQPALRSQVEQKHGVMTPSTVVSALRSKSHDTVPEPS